MDDAFGKVGKHEVVVYRDLAAGQRVVIGLKPDALILVLDLMGLGLGLPVRSDDTVGTEVARALLGRSLRSPCAAIREIFFSRLGVGLPQSLVHKVPDIHTLHMVVGLPGIPILIQVTIGVTHGVGIFTFNTGLILAGVLHAGGAGIHGGVHIRAAVLALIMGHAGGVQRLGPLLHSVKGGAAAGLVAKGVHDHAGMVFIPVDHAVQTVHHVDRGLRIALGQQDVFAVGLHVGLVHDINAIVITKVIEIRVIGIVAGTHGIDVQFLHQQNVFQHLFPGHIPTGLRVGLVTVHTQQLYIDPVGVDEGIHDLEVAEAHRAADRLNDVAVGVLQHQYGLIEVWLFRRPQRGAVHLLGCGQEMVPGDVGEIGLVVGGLIILLGSNGRDGGAHQLIVVGIELGLQGISVGCDAVFIVDIGTHLERCFFIPLFQDGVHFEIPDMYLGRGVERHITENTAQADEILGLKETAARPAVHPHGDLVLTRLKIIGNVKSGCGIAVLVITHHFTVHIEVITGLHAAEPDKHLTAIPVLRQGHRLDIGAHRVIDMGREELGPVSIPSHHRPGEAGHVAHAARPPGIVFVGIDGIVRIGCVFLAPVGTLPASGDLDGAPALRLGVEALGSGIRQGFVVRAEGQIEFPVAVEGHMVCFAPRRLPLAQLRALQGRRYAVIGNISGVGTLSVD